MKSYVNARFGSEPPMQSPGVKKSPPLAYIPLDSQKEEVKTNAWLSKFWSQDDPIAEAAQAALKKKEQGSKTDTYQSLDGAMSQLMLDNNKKT